MIDRDFVVIGDAEMIFVICLSIVTIFAICLSIVWGIILSTIKMNKNRTKQRGVK